MFFRAQNSSRALLRDACGNRDMVKHWLWSEREGRLNRHVMSDCSYLSVITENHIWLVFLSVEAMNHRDTEWVELTPDTHTYLKLYFALENQTSNKLLGV